MSESVTQPNTQAVDALYQGIKQLVDGARSQVLTQVNQALVLTYWHIGKTIKTQVLQSERATYGAGVLKQLALRLTQDYGSGFSHSGLTRMAKFFEALPDEAIVATLSQQLSWSHFVELIKLDDPTQRSFYTDLCIQSRWSVRILRERMDSMLFERMSQVVPESANSLHAELRTLIASRRQRLAGTVNAELTSLYWTVGQRLCTEVLGGNGGLAARLET